MDQGNIPNMKYYHKTNVMSCLFYHVDTMEDFFLFSLVTILQIGLSIMLVPERLFKVKH